MRALIVVLSAVLAAPVLRAQSLANRFIRASFGPRGLTGLVDLGTRTTYRLADGFTISLDSLVIASASLPAARRTRTPTTVTYRWHSGRFDVSLVYELRPGWRFVSKQVEVTVDGDETFQIQDVTPVASELESVPADRFVPRSARPALGTGAYGVALRFDNGSGMLVVVQNPFVRVTQGGREVQLEYDADMGWDPSWGTFRTDRALLAPYHLTGRLLPAMMVPEWRTVPVDSAPGMDEAEMEAFTGMVRAFLLDERESPINVFVGWTANDYQIDVGTPAGRAEYKRLLDRAAEIGAQYVLYAPSNSTLSRREDSVDDWSWEHVLWLGLGQKIRRGEWDVATSPMPPSVQEMLDYAHGKGLRLLAYVYPVMPFVQNPAWLVPGRRSGRKNASLGSRALQDWLVEELVRFHDRTGIAGYSFDHTFLTYDGSSRYAQWYGWRRVMEELRRRMPDIVIDGRQQYHLYGPWSWLAGSYPHPTFNDEQPESFVPFPDLHFDRVSADRERWTAYRYRNYEFAPSEIVPGYMTHQTSRSADDGEMPATRTSDRGLVLTRFRARDWDYLGWRYSVLSSIAVGGWNNVIDMIPARDSAENASFSQQDIAWWRGMLDWTVQNRELLRHTRNILGQPAFGKVDGTSAIMGDHGVLFLFNPNARRFDARFALDSSIGLVGRGQFDLTERYPLAGRRLARVESGTWMYGDSVRITLDGGSAMMLEVAPSATDRDVPRLYGAPGTAELAHDTLELRDVRGEVGTTARLVVLLPRGAAVSRARVNGVVMPTLERRGDAVALDVRFAGERFGKLQNVLPWDPTFTGGTISGTLRIPRRILEQLAARRRAWPIPWTSDDYRTTWLVPERLLLYVQVAEPDDRWDARLTIDGRPVELRKAYSSVRTVRRDFVGFYADLSLLDADRDYRFALELPPLAPGQFQGLFFENVEPEYTTAVVPVR